MTIARTSLLFVLFLGLIAGGCSSDPPSLRVRNDHVNKANVQFKPVSGNTININDVASATTTNYQEIAEGTYGISATISASSDTPSGVMTAEKGYNYTVVILNTKPASIRVDSEQQ